MKKLLVCLALLLMLPAAARAETFNDDGLSLELPKGWVQVSRPVLDAYYRDLRAELLAGSSEAVEVAGEMSAFEHGFAPAGGDALAEQPHLLLDLRGYDAPPTVSAAERNEIFKAELVKVLTDITKLRPAVLYERYDPESGIYTLETKVYNREKANEVFSASVAYRSRGYVVLYWCTTEQDYGRYVDTLRSAAASLKVKDALR